MPTGWLIVSDPGYHFNDATATIARSCVEQALGLVKQAPDEHDSI
jgi:hypothetical protein